MRVTRRSFPTRRSSDLNSNFLDKAITHTRWNAKTFAATNTITDLAPLLVITFAGYQVISGNLSIGTMVAFVAYMEDRKSTRLNSSHVARSYAGSCLKNK